MSILPKKWQTEKICFNYCGDDRCNCPRHPHYNIRTLSAIEKQIMQNALLKSSKLVEPPEGNN